MLVQCPYCEEYLKIKNEQEGEIIECPECYTQLEIVCLDPPILYVSKN